MSPLPLRDMEVVGYRFLCLLQTSIGLRLDIFPTLQVLVGPPRRLRDARDWDGSMADVEGRVCRLTHPQRGFAPTQA
jgi:hypothetical protein